MLFALLAPFTLHSVIHVRAQCVAIHEVQKKSLDIQFSVCLQNLHHLLRRLKVDNGATRDSAPPATSELSSFQEISQANLQSTIDEAWAAAQLLSKAGETTAGTAGAACGTSNHHVAPQPQIAPHFHASRAPRRGTPRLTIAEGQERGMSLPCREGSYVAVSGEGVPEGSGNNPDMMVEERCRSADTAAHTGMLSNDSSET